MNRLDKGEKVVFDRCRGALDYPLDTSEAGKWCLIITRFDDASILKEVSFGTILCRNRSA